MIRYTFPYYGNIPSNLTKDDLLFDIETTGLNPSGSILYLIGTLTFQVDHWVFIQIFNEDGDSERDIILEFFKLLSPSTILIHYNGTSFDLPYLKKRCQILEIDASLFCSLSHYDCYTFVRPFKKMLDLLDCRQTTMEKIAGYERTDHLPAHKLIEQYFLYLKLQKEEQRNHLLLHNLDDLSGLMMLLHFTALLPCDIPSIHFQKNGIIQKFICSWSLTEPFPTELFLRKKLPFSKSMEKTFYFHHKETENSILPFISLHIDKCNLTLTCSIFTEELKFFYPDYQNYYYLPAEDMSIHKSVAAYVEKKYRQKAKASNCYIKKNAEFLPALGALSCSLFYYTYRDKSAFFLVDDLLSNSGESKTFCFQWIQNAFRFFGLPTEIDCFLKKL